MTNNYDGWLNGQHKKFRIGPIYNQSKKIDEIRIQEITYIIGEPKPYCTYLKVYNSHIDAVKDLIAQGWNLQDCYAYIKYNGLNKFRPSNTLPFGHPGTNVSSKCIEELEIEKLLNYQHPLTHAFRNDY